MYAGDWLISAKRRKAACANEGMVKPHTYATIYLLEKS